MKFASLALLALVGTTEGRHHHQRNIGVRFLNTESDMQVRSDPICGSAGCVKTKHDLGKEKPYPMNYEVPDFGADPDIANTLKHSTAINPGDAIFDDDEAKDKFMGQFAVDKEFTLGPMKYPRTEVFG